MKLTPAQRRFLVAAATGSAYRESTPPHRVYVKGQHGVISPRIVKTLRDLDLVIPDHNHRTALAVPFELTATGQALHDTIIAKRNPAS